MCHRGDPEAPTDFLHEKILGLPIFTLTFLKRRQSEEQDWRPGDGAWRYHIIVCEPLPRGVFVRLHLSASRSSEQSHGWVRSTRPGIGMISVLAILVWQSQVASFLLPRGKLSPTLVRPYPRTAVITRDDTSG